MLLETIYWTNLLSIVASKENKLCGIYAPFLMIDYRLGGMLLDLHKAC